MIKNWSNFNESISRPSKVDAKIDLLQDLSMDLRDMGLSVEIWNGTKRDDRFKSGDFEEIIGDRDSLLPIRRDSFKQSKSIIMSIDSHNNPNLYDSEEILDFEKTLKSYGMNYRRKTGAPMNSDHGGSSVYFFFDKQGNMTNSDMIKESRKEIPKFDENTFKGDTELYNFINQDFVEDIFGVVLKYEETFYDDLSKEIDEFKYENAMGRGSYSQGYRHWIDAINGRPNRSYAKKLFIVNKIIDFYNTIVKIVEVDENGYAKNPRIQQIENIINNSLDEDDILSLDEYLESRSGCCITLRSNKSRLNLADFDQIYKEIKMIIGRIMDEFNLKVDDINIEREGNNISTMAPKYIYVDLVDQ
jgi:hypothetical protein